MVEAGDDDDRKDASKENGPEDTQSASEPAGSPIGGFQSILRTPGIERVKFPTPRVPGPSPDVVRILGQNLARSIRVPGLGEAMAAKSQAITGILAHVNKQLAPQLAEIYATWGQTLGGISAAAVEKYENSQSAPTAYSDAMESPASYFLKTERVITSFSNLNEAIGELIDLNPGLPLVWRGAKNHDWGMHSHLFRRLMELNGVASPSDNPSEKQNYPDEDALVAAEVKILRIARKEWRFDGLSALETFARIQHAGGPTRMLDITRNPYIAAWFAVESDPTHDEYDGRLFALATRPAALTGPPPMPESSIELDEVGSLRDPFWHFYNKQDRIELEWGTGTARHIWFPPNYDNRIAAQNAGFLLDGVPITSKGTAPYFRSESSKYWRRADLLAASSVYAKMYSTDKKPPTNKLGLAPTFSFRITAEAKAEIRATMESRFGYSRATIYPDVSALADHLKQIDLS